MKNKNSAAASYHKEPRSRVLYIFEITQIQNLALDFTYKN